MRQARFWKLAHIVHHSVHAAGAVTRPGAGPTRLRQGQGGPSGDGSHPPLSGLHAPLDQSAPRTTISSMIRRSSGCLRSTSRRVAIIPGWPRARRWPRTAGPGASSCRRACSSTTAMASSRPRTWCTTTPCGVTLTIQAARTPRRRRYKQGMCAVQRVEVINDHEIVMHCKVVCLDLQFYYSSASSVIIFSKAQWDKEGEMGYETRPAGTGPYIFKERQWIAMSCTSVPRRRTGSGAWWTGKRSR